MNPATTKLFSDARDANLDVNLYGNVGLIYKLSLCVEWRAGKLTLSQLILGGNVTSTLSVPEARSWLGLDA